MGRGLLKFTAGNTLKAMELFEKSLGNWEALGRSGSQNVGMFCEVSRFHTIGSGDLPMQLGDTAKAQGIMRRPWRWPRSWRGWTRRTRRFRRDVQL